MHYIVVTKIHYACLQINDLSILFNMYVYFLVWFPIACVYNGIKLITALQNVFDMLLLIQ